MAGMTRQIMGLTLALLLFGPRLASACTCSPWPPGATHQAPFLSVVEPTSLVVVAQVRSYAGKRHTARRIPEAMVVEVSEVLKGAIGAKRIRVRGDNGRLCRPYVTTFPVGSSWVLHLSPAPERTGEYMISACGEHWLPIAGGSVSGHILPDPRQTAPEITISLSELRGRFVQ
jgi:hypothetical protein